ncbi:CENP-A histone chaperone Scm3 [Schizosaccharomyces osmophilus]|uniref:CENP-A histone chaperone Scm3 n=1 Tax=Schizosaccharomyces osmophilus TaxID=2545709 RepID=A0AAF0AW15_9SCHI|nr:CENP-A histone chaperone Scm3 [Schizosaccharomyces osmophilus]WBW73067.1 CENP-A histone chaperone Scm3 [Schizosaccharomyces osmophilus]
MNSFQNEDHASFGNPDSHPFHADAPTSAFACPTQLSTIEDLLESRRASQKRYEEFLTSLFEKYGRDTSDIADEIDLSTGKIVVNRGHLLGLKNKNDVWTVEDETNNAQEDTSAAFALPSSKLTKGENQTPVENEKTKQCNFDIAEDVPLVSFFQNRVGSLHPFNQSSFSKASHPKKEIETTCVNTIVKEQGSHQKSSFLPPASSQSVPDSFSEEDAAQKSKSKDLVLPKPKPKPNHRVKEISHPSPSANEDKDVKDSQAESNTNNPFQTPEKPSRKGSTPSKRPNSFSTSTKKRNFVSLLSMVSPRPSFVYKDSQNFVAKPVSTSQISAPFAKHHSKENCGKAFCFGCLSRNRDQGKV